MLLHDSHPTGTGICLSSMAQHVHEESVMTETVSRLRAAVEFAIPFCRTKRFQTYVLPYSLIKISIK